MLCSLGLVFWAVEGQAGFDVRCLLLLLYIIILYYYYTHTYTYIIISISYYILILYSPFLSSHSLLFLYHLMFIPPSLSSIFLIFLLSSFLVQIIILTPHVLSEWMVEVWCVWSLSVIDVLSWCLLYYISSSDLSSVLPHPKHLILFSFSSNHSIRVGVYIFLSIYCSSIPIS